MPARAEYYAFGISFLRPIATEDEGARVFQPDKERSSHDSPRLDSRTDFGALTPGLKAEHGTSPSRTDSTPATGEDGPRPRLSSSD